MQKEVETPESLDGHPVVAVEYAKQTWYPEELSEKANGYFVCVLATGSSDCSLEPAHLFSSEHLASLLNLPRTTRNT